MRPNRAQIAILSPQKYCYFSECEIIFIKKISPQCEKYFNLIEYSEFALIYAEFVLEMQTKVNRGGVFDTPSEKFARNDEIFLEYTNFIHYLCHCKSTTPIT